MQPQCLVNSPWYLCCSLRSVLLVPHNQDNGSKISTSAAQIWNNKRTALIVLNLSYIKHLNLLGKSVFKFCKTTNILQTIKTIIQDHVFGNNHTCAKPQTLISMQPQYLVNITCPCTLRFATHCDIYVAHLEVFCWYSTARAIVQRSARVLHKSETSTEQLLLY